MSGAVQALATLRDYIQRSTHWQEGGADRHAALLALRDLEIFHRLIGIGTEQVEDWFAWYPVRTVTGGYVWLKAVKRRWNPALNHWGYDGHSGTDGGWEHER